MLIIVMPSVSVKPSVIGLSISFYPMLFFTSYMEYIAIFTFVIFI